MVSLVHGAICKIFPATEVVSITDVEADIEEEEEDSDKD